MKTTSIITLLTSVASAQYWTATLCGANDCGLAITSFGGGSTFCEKVPYDNGYAVMGNKPWNKGCQVGFYFDENCTQLGATLEVDPDSASPLPCISGNGKPFMSIATLTTECD